MRLQHIGLVLAALMVTLAVACQPAAAPAPTSAPAAKPAATSAPAAQPAATAQPAAAAAASGVTVDKSKWPKGITVASAAVGGVYYAWAAGWQKVLTNNVGIPTNVEVTGGSVQNIQLVNKGDSTFGITTSSNSYEGWNGDAWAKGTKYQDVRLVLPMYSSLYQGVALEKSGIKGMQDLNGKVVGLGPKGGGGDAMGRSILDALGIQPKRIVNAEWADLNDQMKDGLLDAQITMAGLPQSSFTELEATQKITFFGVGDADAKKVIDKYPYYVTATIPAGAYKAVTAAVPTISVWIMTIANKSLPEDFVYTVVKESYANQATIIAAHPAGKEMPKERAASSPIPVHSGAIKYFQEQGVKFPDKAIPPEFKK